MIRSVEDSPTYEAIMTLEKGTSSRRTKQITQEAVSRFIEELNETFDPDKQSLYEELFFRRMAHLSEDVFDRSTIGDDILAIIAPRYFSAYKEYRENSTDVGLKKLTSDVKFYRTSVKVIRLALKLGIHPEPVASGWNGSYFLRDLFGKRLAIFKACDEEVLAENSSSYFRRVRSFAKLSPFGKTLAFLHSGNAYKSEYMASLLCYELKLQNIPTTKIESLKSFSFQSRKKSNRRVQKTGSLQLYLPEVEPAGKVLGLPRHLSLNPRRKNFASNISSVYINQKDFESMVILDFLSGQLDRHPYNWCIGDGIFLIDHGATFPHKHSDSSISRLNQYAWSILPNAQFPFSEFALQKVELFIRHQDRIIARFRKKELFSHEGQVSTFRERAKVLYHYVMNKKTPRDVSKIRSTKDFKKALKVIDKCT